MTNSVEMRKYLDILEEATSIEEKNIFSRFMKKKEPEKKQAPEKEHADALVNKILEVWPLWVKQQNKKGTKEDFVEFLQTVGFTEEESAEIVSSFMPKVQPEEPEAKEEPEPQKELPEKVISDAVAAGISLGWKSTGARKAWKSAVLKAAQSISPDASASDLISAALKTDRRNEEVELTESEVLELATRTVDFTFANRSSKKLTERGLTAKIGSAALSKVPGRKAKAAALRGKKIDALVSKMKDTWHDLLASEKSKPTYEKLIDFLDRLGFEDHLEEIMGAKKPEEKTESVVFSGLERMLSEENISGSALDKILTRAADIAITKDLTVGGISARGILGSASPLQSTKEPEAEEEPAPGLAFGKEVLDTAKKIDPEIEAQISKAFKGGIEASTQDIKKMVGNKVDKPQELLAAIGYAYLKTRKGA